LEGWEMGIFSKFCGNNSEFYLEDVIEKNKQFPRTFLIPTQEEIDKLDIGDLIKLVFVMKKPQGNGCRAEKMWVRVTDIQKDKFTGMLDNDPYYLKSIKAGHIITFKAINIACIYGGESSFNEKLYAIITQKALERRQINWVVRMDDLADEQDSGWQLFYGDGSQEYLDDSSNARIVSLEPLLGSVFNSPGYAYEYSDKDNKFIEVKEE